MQDNKKYEKDNIWNNVHLYQFKTHTDTMLSLKQYNYIDKMQYSKFDFI